MLICGVDVFAQDTTPPVVTVPPQSVTVPCEGTDPTIAFTQWYNTAGGAQATDNSGTVIFVPNIQFNTALNIFNNSKDTLCGNTKNVRLSWIASDPSNNTAGPFFATFSLTDLLKPSVITQPIGVSIECTSSSQDSLVKWIRTQGGARAIDVCSPTVDWVLYSYSTSTGISMTDSIKSGNYPTIPTNVCNWSVNVSFIVVDECGNDSPSSIRKFEVRDTKAPVLSSTPADVTVQCSEVPPRPVLTAVDACSGSVPVSFTETKTQNPDTTKCDHYNYTILRKWNAADACNNVVEHIQKITVIDNRAPLLSGKPSITIECSNTSILDSLLTSKKDNCSPVFITFSDSLISGLACNLVVKRTYDATDICLNRSTFSQIITTIDKSAPVINTPSKSQGIDCNSVGDVNLAFTAWMNARGMSSAFDKCNNGLKSFAAVPGSYNLKDTLTFPGTYPGQLDAADCDAQPKGYSRSEKVDFVYYDKCGNASVTSAFFGITDNSAPVVTNCQSNITKEVDAADCTSSVDIEISTATDDCSQYSSPLVRFASSIIRSDMPGNNEIIVNPVTLIFGPYNSNAFTLNGNATLNVDLSNTDADDESEFFNVLDEDGNVVGKTNKTNNQCGDSQTSFVIDQTKIQSWLSDGFINFTLVPNVGPIPTLSINDVCPVISRANSAISFPINTANLIKTYYTENNSTDTIDISGQSLFTKQFSTGTYDIKILYEDCAKNVTACNINLKVNDKIAPQVLCSKDTILTLSQSNCLEPIAFPLDLKVIDNCKFPADYNATSPTTAETQKISFKYIENGSIHVANNKVISFTNTPLIKYSDSDAELTVNVTGDFNNNKEFFYIVGEGGTPIGQTDFATSSSCVTTSTHFVIPKSVYNLWAADGKIDITAVANIEGNEEALSINPCQPLSPSQTVDDNSKIVMQLVTRQPKISYQLDNGTLTDINLSSSSINLDLTGGKHTLKFTTLDQAGNNGSCNVNVEVRDTIAPVAKCKNFIAKIHPSGLIDYIVSPDSINNASTDNCAIDSMWTENNVFSCSDVGTEKTITLFVKDNYDNKSQCTARVKIEAVVLVPTFTSGLCDGDTLRLFSNVPPPVDNNVFTYEWYKDGVLIANTQNPIFPGTNATFNGLYRVVAKGFNNCLAEGVMNINIKPLSTPILTSTQDSYCDDEEIQLKTDVFSGNVKYEWYEGFPPNGVLIGSTTVAEFNFTASANTHNYYVIGKSPECVSNPSLTKRIFVFKKPEVVLLSYFQNVCEGDEIKLGTSTVGANYKYTWKGPPAFESNLQNPFPITNAQSINQGKYQLVINIDQCKSDTASTNVVILPKPQQPDITGESTYCEGSTFSLIVKNIPLQEKYIWIKDGLRYSVTQDNSLEILNVPITASGKWQVVVESNGCASDTSDFKNIDIDNLTLVGASNNGPVCEGDTIELNATFVPNASYSWQGPGGLKALGQSIKLPAKNGEYSVTITTTTGCQDVTSTKVEVNQSPIITALSNNSTACVDGKTEVTFFPSVIPPGNFTYKWTGPNQFTSDLVNPKISNVTELNNGAYILTVTNKNCPSRPDTSLIDVQLLPPKAPFTIPASICEGDTLTLVTAAVADSFSWHTPTGVFKSINGKLTIANIKKVNQGNYHLIIKSGDCESRDFDVSFLEVKEKPLPVGIIGKNEICFGESINLSTNNASITSAVWTLPNGDKYTGLTLPIINASSTNSGPYAVQASVNGCTADLSNAFTIKVRDKIEQPKLLTGKIEICSNENQPFDACVIPLEGGITYVWKSNGTIITNTNADCVGFNTDDFKIGQNFIEISAQKDGCQSLTSSQLQIDKNVAPNIIAKANFDELTACASDELVELSAEIKEPLVDVKWSSLSPGISIFSPESDKTVVQKFQTGLNLVLLSYSKDGCNNFSTDTVKIFVFNKPIANDDVLDVGFNENKDFDVLLNDSLGRFYTIEIDEPKQGNLNGSNGNYTFEPRTGFAGSVTLTYKLCVEGCDNLCDEAEVTLKVGNGISCVVPSIITPNDDGINDEFIIPCLNVGNYPNNELIIFNQWGDQVYAAKPYSNNWKGTYGDDALPVGTYFYIFNPGNGGNRLNGFFIIQR